MLAAFEHLDPPVGTPWRAVRDAILPPGHHPETAEALLSLLLELFPDIVAHSDARLVADESADVDPAMTVGALAGLARASYDWLPGDDKRKCPHFWYYPLESPYEPRRGLRGTGTSFETETPMDLPRLLPRLLTALAEAPGDMPVGIFLARHPELAQLTGRVQSLAGLDYAELQVDSLAADYLPFADCRFLLAYYGMETTCACRARPRACCFRARHCRTRSRGIDGDWPFRSPRGRDSGARVIVPQRLARPARGCDRHAEDTGRRAPARDRDAVTVFPAEMRKLRPRGLRRRSGAAAADAVVRLRAAGGRRLDRRNIGDAGRASARARAMKRDAFEGTGLP